MPSTHFRTATETDIPALVTLVTSAYRGDASRAGWTTEADLLDGNRIDPELLRADLLRPRSQVVLLETHDDAHTAIQACAHVCVDADAGYFGMFAVAPTLQGSGIGKLLLAECERIVRDDWQLSRMRMTVIEQRSSLIAFYERRGYRRTGQFKPFPYGDPRFGLPKRDDLRFELLEKHLRMEAAA